MTFSSLRRLIGTAFLLALTVQASRAVETLQNAFVSASFDEHGLAALHDKTLNKTLGIARDSFSAQVDDQTLDTASLQASVEPAAPQTRTFHFAADPWTVIVVYELRPEWKFVSKQVFITTAKGGTFRVQKLEVLRGDLDTAAVGKHPFSSGTFLRFPAIGSGGGYGLFALAQNPFTTCRAETPTLSLSYAPDMAWNATDGPFASDRVCLGLYGLSGVEFPSHPLGEWRYVIDGAPLGGPTVDMAEVDAVTECVRAFLLWHPTRSLRVHVGWCENDYQIDIGTPEGRTEYGRIIDQAAAFGCGDLLFTPAFNRLAPLSENRDAWGWENVLWLNLGQKIRKGEWDPRKDPLPPEVAELLDHAKARNLQALAYVYPSLPFMQNPAWTSWIKGPVGGYAGADTGQRSFQDWLTDTMVTFAKSTGVGGFSFDHWWIAYDKTPSSPYAQWAGCRRVLEELRRRLPDTVIDGRQQYHQFGEWTWLAGSYPHPLASDEQPGSFPAFSDLHFDRVSADRQRSAAWHYRMVNFVPPEIMPGYITHQTQRIDPTKSLRRDRFRATDWDYLGWRYSLISSVGTAPFNHVINFLPARDEAEFRLFPEADKKWFRDWLDWTDRNADILRHLRPIIGQPRIGQVDGTAAFQGEHGFVFLFNPNYRALPAGFTLDASVGLAAGGHPLVIRQLYPEAERGRLLAPPPGKAFWQAGDRVLLDLPGTDAMVLEVSPASEGIREPLLMGTTGSATLTDGQLALSGVSGETGTTREISIALPNTDLVKGLIVNGVAVPSRQDGSLLTASVGFAGTMFRHSQQIGQRDPAFRGGTYAADITIPPRVFAQLAARQRVWPIAYTSDDLLATWLGSQRLLLFINIADPNDKMPVTLKIDGQPVEARRAYTSVYPDANPSTFVGWYADVSSLQPDVKHTFEVDLPKLEAGQFQGLFFDNVEAEFTQDISAPHFAE